MATIPPYNLNTKYPVIITGPPISHQAEYDAAIEAYNDHSALTDPVRKEYDAVFFRHRQNQTKYHKIMDKASAHRKTYQAHKRYVISLSNALLTSNVTLRSAPKPFTDFQALTHATLLDKIRLGSHTLTTMLYQNLRIDKARNASWKLDQELFEKCTELYKVMDADSMELDRLHAKVLEIEKKMGGKFGCGMVEGACISCTRLKEREASRAAAAAVVAAAENLAKAMKGGSGKAGKGSKAKQRLEDIAEEEGLADDNNGWV
ncbi:MAG: hypothetical protein ASARMPREDX12_007156 [Alectoria sarmentosa]|nr:MAG: hypothetical protein ASARMPREDX12_007156 [Alectoria sarmentosa]